VRNQQAIFERVREHEIMAEKFHQLEVKLLSTLDYRAFFQTLLGEIAAAFAIPHVWFTLIRESEIAELMQRTGARSSLRERLVTLSHEAFTAILGDADTPLLVNRDLDRFRALFPQQHCAGIGSLSVVPIQMDGQLIGSLNQADPGSERYRPGLSTLFLERLAVKLSLGLSNITAHEKLRILAYHDPLTRLLNRRVMETLLERELSRSQRYGNTLSLAFIDLNDFKRVNDRYGHDVGDQLLRYTASGLEQMVRASDVVTRYAGDEFVILLPETTAVNARRLVERIRDAFLRQPLQWNGLTVPVSLSSGIASTEETGIRTPQDLLRQADQDLYRLKRAAKVRSAPPSADSASPEESLTH